MSRLPSFRARQIDINAQLVIVRSTDELTEEGTVTRVVHHGHEQLDRENEEARAVARRGCAPAARRAPRAAAACRALPGQNPRREA